VLLGLLYASARVAFAFRLAPSWRTAATRIVSSLRDQSIAVPAVAVPAAPAVPAEGRSRAAMVVDAISSAQRREAAATTPVTLSGRPYAVDATPAAQARSGRDLPDRVAPAPLGQSFRRSTRARVSSSARRRDRMS